MHRANKFIIIIVIIISKFCISNKIAVILFLPYSTTSYKGRILKGGYLSYLNKLVLKFWSPTLRSRLRQRRILDKVLGLNLNITGRRRKKQSRAESKRVSTHQGSTEAKEISVIRPLENLLRDKEERADSENRRPMKSDRNNLQGERRKHFTEEKPAGPDKQATSA